MGNTSFAEQLMSAHLMLTGLTANLEALSTIGINQEFVDTLNQQIADATAQNDEQERLKAQLKTQTDTLNKTLEQLKHSMSEAQKRVKIQIPQTQWKEFGINAKR